MARVAWVAGQIDYDTTLRIQRAWVFPHGLQVGRQVLHYRNKDKYGRFRPCPCPEDGTSANRTWVIGEVAGIEGDTVTFAWFRAAGEYLMWGKAYWSECPPPTGDLLLQEDADEYRVRGFFRHNFAGWNDEFEIEWPEEVGALIPTHTFVVTVASHAAIADGKVRVALITMSGDKLEVQVDQGASAGALMEAVAIQRQLGASVRVCVMSSDGVVMERGSALPC
mmetsp:Transcript_29652/g.89795  ORF Transcript_29652/g.89795 Transcript_29652/m.89795 type:complete len:223 (-) Transcript_29652:120-788(-)